MAAPRLRPAPLPGTLVCVCARALSDFVLDVMFEQNFSRKQFKSSHRNGSLSFSLSGLSKWIAEEVDTSGKVDLTAARVVIGGGRGLKNGDNFKLLYEMANKIGNCAGPVLYFVCMP